MKNNRKITTGLFGLPL